MRGSVKRRSGGSWTLIFDTGEATGREPETLLRRSAGDGRGDPTWEQAPLVVNEGRPAPRHSVQCIEGGHARELGDPERRRSRAR
jgi:hypothetical protein